MSEIVTLYCTVPHIFGASVATFTVPLHADEQKYTIGYNGIRWRTFIELAGDIPVELLFERHRDGTFAFCTSAQGVLPSIISKTTRQMLAKDDFTIRAKLRRNWKNCAL